MASEETERSQRARYAATIRSAREPSGTAMTETAREAQWRQRYEAAGITPDLPDKERERREKAVRTARMIELSRKATLARQRLAAAQHEAIQAEAEMIAGSGDIAV